MEGNTSGGAGVVENGGGVFEKSYARTYERILGYGLPDWGLAPLEGACWRSRDNGAMEIWEVE